MTSPLKVALVGYGVGGRYFHAPFIDAADGLELTTVVTRSAGRRTQLAQDFPDVRPVDDLAAALALGPDLVVVTTPPETRRELVLQAIAAAVPVIADKPFAPDARAARELRDAAAAAAVPLGVFYNRRYDADIRTVAAVIRSGALGTIQRFTSRFDLDEPGGLEATPGGGLLRDLGSHLADQAMWLFGPVVSVYAELDWLDTANGPVDAGFLVTLTHASGVRSLLAASKVNRAEQRELRLLGTAGSFRSDGTDVQAKAIFAGRRPSTDSSWGKEREARWGVISVARGQDVLPSERGAYQDYYSEVAAALTGRKQLPVPAEDGVAVSDVLDAARQSDLEGRVITMTVEQPAHG